MEKNVSAANHFLRFFIYAAINRKRIRKKNKKSNVAVFILPAADNHLDNLNVAVFSMPAAFNAPNNHLDNLNAAVFSIPAAFNTFKNAPFNVKLQNPLLFH